MSRSKKHTKKTTRLGHMGDDMKLMREGKFVARPKVDDGGQSKKQRKKVGKLKKSRGQYGHHARKAGRKKTARKRA